MAFVQNRSLNRIFYRFRRLFCFAPELSTYLPVDSRVKTIAIQSFRTLSVILLSTPPVIRDYILTATAKESMQTQTIRIDANLDGKNMGIENALAWTRLALFIRLLKPVSRLLKPASNPFQTGVPLELIRSSSIPSRQLTRAHLPTPNL